MSTLISADNSWALFAILVVIAGASITLEQKYQWANRITGAIIALVSTMLLANFNVIPTAAPAFDFVWSYVVILAIPLLLFNCNIREIGAKSGRLLLVFLIGAIGTAIGAVSAAFLLGDKTPELPGMAAAFTGTYIGGSVNFAAMNDAFGVSGATSSAAVVADNLLMVVYFTLLIAAPGMKFFRKHYKHPLIDELEAGGSSDVNQAAEHWKAKPISLQNIAFDFAAAFAIVAISKAIAGFFASTIPATGAWQILNTLLGSQYLIITTVTMICATAFPKVFGSAAGANELGTFLIYIFFAVIGAPASVMEIVKNAPILFVFAFIVVFCNMLVTFAAGKFLKFNLEDCIIASNANIGGPTTAAAMAISKGWGSLVGPAMLVGTFGYVVGNYIGIIVGNMFM